ncbi:MAG: FKBP-type peptidyl-prolyl cis-trans isomerase [Candidatus Saccharibacteria bacterium]
MARKRDRIFALFGAGLFFLTSFGLSFAVIWQLVKDNNSNKSNTATSTATNSSKLQGTRLAGFTPIASIPTLQSTDTQTGTGSTAKAGDTVTVDYTGAVAATGIIFQSSKDSGNPVSLDLNNVIEGWKEGIPGMKVGGVRRLLIPAAMAYGANPPSGSGIPANADLVFDVTLDAIGK